jgi:hypothetical protein
MTRPVLATPHTIRSVADLVRLAVEEPRVEA